MKIGIVGLPNVGKSTLFKALTKKEVDIQNYPFCTIEPNIGVVAVPDGRLNQLAKFSNSKKIVPTIIEFVDIAGLIKDAHQGAGLGNKFLSHIREVDAILQTVRIFEDEKITHTSNKIDPLDDIETINMELIFADEETIAKRMEKTSRDAKRNDKKAIVELEILNKIKQTLKEQKPVHSLIFNDEEGEIAKSLQLLTAKPVIYILNKSIGKKNLDETKNERFLKLLDFLNKNKNEFVVLDANFELEVNGLPETEIIELRNESKLDKDQSLEKLIILSYKTLNLITFLTTGEDETRAWTIKNGSTAPQAGKAIHSDFEEKFIKAEVIYWGNLIKAGSYKAAKQNGLMRTEGKEYIVKDGDVIEFKI